MAATRSVGSRTTVGSHHCPQVHASPLVGLWLGAAVGEGSGREDPVLVGQDAMSLRGPLLEENKTTQ